MDHGATPEEILQAMMADEFQPGEQVIINAFKAFNEHRASPLAERLILALKAGCNPS